VLTGSALWAVRDSPRGAPLRLTRHGRKAWVRNKCTSQNARRCGAGLTIIWSLAGYGKIAVNMRTPL
jgi:hypothetical protein